MLKKYNELKTKKNFNGINPELIREISLIKNKFEKLYTFEAIKEDGMEIAQNVISAQAKDSSLSHRMDKRIGQKT